MTFRFLLAAAIAAGPALPQALAALRFGMSRSAAESALGDTRQDCLGYGQYQVAGFCVVLGFWEGALDEVSLVFTGVEEAHARMTAGFGAPVTDGNRELWLGGPGGEPLRAALAPYLKGARLDFTPYLPLARLFGAGGKIAGRQLVGTRPAAIRIAFGKQADCQDRGFCTVFIPTTEFGPGGYTVLHLEVAAGRVRSVLFSVSAPDSASNAETLRAAERVWGTARRVSAGLSKQSLTFSGAHATAEVSESEITFCIGRCP